MFMFMFMQMRRIVRPIRARTPCVAGQWHPRLWLHSLKIVTARLIRPAGTKRCFLVGGTRTSLRRMASPNHALARLPVER